jgi:hypothetical protein
MVRLRRRLFDIAVRTLTRPLGSYDLVLPNDLDNLRRYIRKGDVILVDGDQRISQVIKYLTQSSWSHVALYVGDEIVRRFPGRRDELIATHGPDAQHMVVEALVESGVTTTPLVKYGRLNLRVCRPHGLRRDDLQSILDEVIGQLGLAYDLRNALDLARYFMPVSLIPRRFRRRALEIGSGLPTEVICSSLIARAFQNVGFPVLPVASAGGAPPRPTWMGAFLRRRRLPYAALFHRQVPTLVTPRDFDLSPYFAIVKFNAIEAQRFDYRRIHWA